MKNEVRVLTILGLDRKQIGYVTQTDCEYFFVYTNRAFVGGVKKIELAVDMVWEKTGEKVRALPVVTWDQIRKVPGPKIKTSNFQGGGYYQHTEYFIGDTRIGRTQYKEGRRKILGRGKSFPFRETITLYESGGCSLGYNVGSLCIQAGYRLQT